LYLLHLTYSPKINKNDQIKVCLFAPYNTGGDAPKIGGFRSA
jgi:hypothetical protein